MKNINCQDRYMQMQSSSRLIQNWQLLIRIRARGNKLAKKSRIERINIVLSVSLKFHIISESKKAIYKKQVDVRQRRSRSDCGTGTWPRGSSYCSARSDRIIKQCNSADRVNRWLVMIRRRISGLLIEMITNRQRVWLVYCKLFSQFDTRLIRCANAPFRRHVSPTVTHQGANRKQSRVVESIIRVIIIGFLTPIHSTVFSTIIFKWCDQHFVELWTDCKLFFFRKKRSNRIR